MKQLLCFRIRRVAVSLLLALPLSAAFAQQIPCDIVITGSFEPACILPTEKQDYYDEDPDNLIACQGMTVTYTANVGMGDHSPTRWSWAVSGDVSSNSNNGSITVTWGHGSSGHLAVTVYGPNGVSCTKSVNVRLVEKPVISVSTVPAYVEMPDGTKVIYVCPGGSVEFTDHSSATNSDIVGFYWERKWGMSSSTPNYKIEDVWADEQIFHWVYNNCGCYDEESFFIRMLEGENLELSCHGTVCEGDVVTYTALSPHCKQFSWHVSGGTILNGQNTPQVTVQWDSPQDGYGVIGIDGQLCGSNSCPAMLSKKIPVIGDNLPIQGQTIVCVDEAVIYSVPLFGSTEYHWSITSAADVSAVDVNGANKQMYIFHQPGTYRITVSYRCEFLDCGEFTSAPLTVVVKPKLAITGQDRICISNPCHLETAPYVSASWIVYDIDNSNQIVYNTWGRQEISTRLPRPGRYRVVASNPNFCNEAEFLLTVQDRPPAPTLADLDPGNPHTACTHSGINLQAHPQNPDYTIVWEPTCPDATPGRISGNDVTISFGANVCDIHAYTFDRTLNCLSAQPYVQQIVELQPAPITLPRHYDVCPGTIISWDDNDIPPQDGVLYEWYIGGAQSYASVQGSHLKNSVVLTVHEHTSGNYPVDFYVLLKRTVCHVFYYDTFHIHVRSHTPAAVSLTANPESACPDEPFTFTGSGGDPANYRWRVDSILAPFVGNPYTCTFTTPGTHRVTLLHNEMDECTNLHYYDSATVLVTVSPAPVINGLIYDAAAQTVSVDMAAGRYTYQWYYNDILQVGQTNPSMRLVGYGTYRCEVENLWGCTASESKYIGPNTPCYECNMIEDMTGTYDGCAAVLTLTSPIAAHNVYWKCSGNSDQRTIIVNPSDRHHATVQFKDVGIYHIQSYTTGSHCEVSNFTKAVTFIPDFTFEKQCDKIVIHNRSKSLSGMERIYFTVAGHAPCMFDYSVRTYEYPVTSNGTYTFCLQVLADGTLYECTYPPVVFTTVNPATLSITSANTLNPHWTCENTPIELTASLNPYAPISSTTWTFSDGTFFTMQGNKIHHTFTSSLYFHSVTASVTDANGCPVTSQVPFTISSHPNELKEYLLHALGSEVCPNTARYIQFQYNGNVLTSCNFYWNGAATPSTNPTYATYTTGLYPAVAVNNRYCHVQDNINVRFKNKPTAIIVTDKQRYCMGDRIMLYGATGPDSNQYTYQWTVTNANNFTRHFYTASASFYPPMADDYHIQLCITDNASGCSDCASGVTVTVHPTPAAPSIAYGQRLCLDDPPVELVGSSPATNRLHWSNGHSGPTAYYFTPGVATAWYYDPASGCKSDAASITIDAQPDFDALLTGCYEKCPDFFLRPRRLPVRGLTTWNQKIDCVWNYNGRDIYADGGIYTHRPLLLPLPGFGDYRLDVDYNHGHCHVASPLLTITEIQEFCDCEDIEITIEKIHDVGDCYNFYSINVTVCSHSDFTYYFHELQCLADPEYVQIVNTDFQPTPVDPDNCFSFKLEVKLYQPLPSQSITFRLYGDCNADFSIDLLPEYIECKTEIAPFLYDLRADMSTSAAVYFKFQLEVFPSQNIIACWSDPPMVVNSWYGGSEHLDGLAMIEYAKITQLVAEDGFICFYALACMDKEFCWLKSCIPAEKFYQRLQDLGITPKQAAKTFGDSGKESDTGLPLGPDPGRDLHLVPNPATGDVTIVCGARIPDATTEALAPRAKGSADKVVEVLVMDMSGRPMATFINTDRFNVSDLPAGFYIVRVRTRSVDAAEKVTYMKLMKK
ncbi:MAG: hypothetical protein AUK63_262 [bacterium P3]|nr:MAG: hypothetical protein AUK63_262 [bacterium P3]KWW42776.1 MAG: hypothetical protein F083_180 [bacterium F083]